MTVKGYQVGYNLLVNRIYWGYNSLTNLSRTSWDIQVDHSVVTSTAPPPLKTDIADMGPPKKNNNKIAPGKNGKIALTLFPFEV